MPELTYEDAAGFVLQFYQDRLPALPAKQITLLVSYLLSTGVDEFVQKAFAMGVNDAREGE